MRSSIFYDLEWTNVNWALNLHLSSKLLRFLSLIRHRAPKHVPFFQVLLDHLLIIFPCTLCAHFGPDMSSSNLDKGKWVSLKQKIFLWYLHHQLMFAYFITLCSILSKCLCWFLWVFPFSFCWSFFYLTHSYCSTSVTSRSPFRMISQGLRLLFLLLFVTEPQPCEDTAAIENLGMGRLDFWERCNISNARLIWCLRNCQIKGRS